MAGMKSKHLIRASLAIAVTALGSARVVVAQQLPTNLGFESHDSNSTPLGWLVSGKGFEIVVDSQTTMAGRFSLQIRRVTTAKDTGRGFASVAQSYPVAVAAGRKLHLTGYIRTQDINTGFAGFWMRVDGPSGSLAFDNMQERAPHGTTPWTRYDIELPVDSGARNVIVGMLLPGDGTAWFDSLTFEVVGAPMPRAVMAFKAAARPPEDMTRLFTDAE